MREEIQAIVDQFYSEKKHPISELFLNQKMTQYSKGLEFEGLYAFWFKRSYIEEMREIFNFDVKLKGAKDEVLEGKYKFYDCTWDWYFNGEWTLLYVGKTTKFKKRLGQHLRLKSKSLEWPISENGTLSKPTTSCQLRSGLEYLMHSRGDLKDIEAKDLMKEHLWISYMEVGDASKRFYAEDLAVGQGCPWFNLDSER